MHSPTIDSLTANVVVKGPVMFFDNPLIAILKEDDSRGDSFFFFSLFFFCTLQKYDISLNETLNDF